MPGVAFPPVGPVGLSSPPSPVLCSAQTATMAISGHFAWRSRPDTLPAFRCVRGIPAGLVAGWKLPSHARAFDHPVPLSWYMVKETGGSPTFPSSPSGDMPRSSGRNTARATLGREFPTCTFSVCAAGSSFRHRSRFRKPPSHPGRSDFPSPVGSQRSSCVLSAKPSHIDRG
jgi:hypothetical protein